MGIRVREGVIGVVKGKRREGLMTGGGVAFVASFKDNTAAGEIGRRAFVRGGETSGDLRKQGGIETESKLERVQFGEGAGPGRRKTFSRRQDLLFFPTVLGVSTRQDIGIGLSYWL